MTNGFTAVPVGRRISGLILFLAILSLIINPIPSAGQTATTSEGIVTVSYAPGHASHSFVPSQSIGAGLDGHEWGEVRRMLSPANIKAMQSSGLRPLTYRLRTELAGEVWHWNPEGKWSDPRHRQGYWISDSNSKKPIELSYGYRLPRRGNTNDQANEDDYSRLDDGDTRTFWKSNPYLDQHFTGEPNEQHPQWAVIDLGEEVQVNAIHILWANPYAIRYQVEYARKLQDEFLPREADWRLFDKGKVDEGQDSDVLLRLSDSPVTARFVRIKMFQASGTAPAGAKDIRDRLGYAIRELYLGTIDESGQLHDILNHKAAHNDQTVMYVSSTDPWHRAIDMDRKIEQPGFDFVYRSGLTNHQPMLTPVGVLYDTPENAAAEIGFFLKRGYPVERVEMGEEPDGQFASPEDYALLYMQWATALHRVNPDLQLGGPGYQSLMFNDPENQELQAFFTIHFINSLRQHNRLGDYNFFSFEWYPFDNVCKPTSPQLAANSELLKTGLEGVKQTVPAGTPILVTELGYSAFGGQPEVDIEGALLNADSVGMFLTEGGDKAYLYGYEPNELISENSCRSVGNNMLFGLGSDGRITYKTSTYWGARMLTEEWTRASDQRVEVYPAHSNIVNEQGKELVTAYALRDQSGKWSLMLVNKDPDHAHSVSLKLSSQSGSDQNLLNGPTDLYQFSSAQYVWHAKGDAGFPNPSKPAAHSVVPGRGAEISLPPYSLSVVRER